MRKFSISNNDLFLSEDFYEQENKTFYLLDRPELKDDFVDYIINFSHCHLGVGGLRLDVRKSFHGLVKKVLGLNRALTMGTLNAHGDSNSNQWVYQDGDRVVPVTDWISQNDGNYDLVLLHVCNPGNITLSLKKSVVLYCKGKVDGTSCRTGNNILSFPSGTEYVVNWKIGEKIGHDYSKLPRTK